MVYVMGVIVLNLLVSVRLDQQNDNRLADRLAAASRDQDVFSQRAPRTFRGAGDGDADSAPVFFWLLVRISVRTPGSRISLTVEDSGPGIVEAERPMLFDRFHRATDQGSGAASGWPSATRSCARPAAAGT